ncbi:hypothetical protein [Peptoniphilus asaccharolyticus]
MELCTAFKNNGRMDIVMKVKFTAHLDISEDEIELDDDLTDDEIAEQVFDYICQFLDIGFREVD